ncbi:MAG: hypothetical protein E7447_04000 [Ruminococcaceae bacterium]|nr:hypothetical protein [Oscillospiraceae bacterium]
MPHTKKQKLKWILGIIAAFLVVGIVAVAIILNTLEFGFARRVSEEEKALRLQVVSTAEDWLGSKESNNSHIPIIDLYNAHEPLAQGYLVKYDDNWCATFGSVVAIQTGLTDIIPTECGCERQINLFSALGCWEEADDYVPLPGDYIFYCTQNRRPGECTAWSDHVGIVVGTCLGFIKVIEGNAGEQVTYRYIPINDVTIRGYGLPDYTSKVNH